MGPILGSDLHLEALRFDRIAEDWTIVMGISIGCRLAINSSIAFETDSFLIHCDLETRFDSGRSVHAWG